jgi:hypothetical protein
MDSWCVCNKISVGNKNANMLTWLFLSWVIIQPFNAQRECWEQQVMMYI